MDLQILFDMVLGVSMLLIGFILKSVIWDSIKEQQAEIHVFLERLGTVEVLIAGEYVKRNEFTKTMERLFNKLDRIEDKLEAKADK